MVAQPQNPSLPDVRYTKEQFEFAMEVMRKQLDEHRKNDPVNTAGTAPSLHGLNPSGTLGLFGYPGTNPRMFSTIVRAAGSFSRALEARGNIFLRERVELLTGVTAETGTNPENFCGTAARPGVLKVCMQDYEFGKMLASTDTVELPEQGAYFSRADIDRTIEPINDPSLFVPDVVTRATNPNSQSWNQMYKLGVSLERQWEKVIIQGNKSAAATGAGSLPYWIKQFEGLDRLIKTGYVDFVSGVACPAVDSRVINFNANLTGSSATFGTLVDTILDVHNGMAVQLVDMGYSFEDLAGAFVVHPRMWRPLTRMWPCNYNTVGCIVVNNDGERINIDAGEQRRMQDEMYAGRYLMVDGMRIPVLFSWAVPITNVGADLYTGSMYFVPFRLGGQIVTWIEYFDMGNAQQVEFESLGGTAPLSRPINGGLYRIGQKAEPFCIEYKLASKARLRFDAPFAAYRIDNITFQDRSRLRSPYIGESYHANGGQTSRGTFSY